jgi:hypothetical protein
MGRTARQSTAKLARPQFLNEQGLIFGIAYDSAAVVPDGTPPPEIADPVTEYLPNARPGSRAPHIWLWRDGKRVSTIDLFGAGFVLLAGRRGGRWCEAVARLADASRPALVGHVIGAGAALMDEGDAWRMAYDVEEDGAVLIPSGWLCRLAPPVATRRSGAMPGGGAGPAAWPGAPNRRLKHTCADTAAHE